MPTSRDVASFPTKHGTPDVTTFDAIIPCASGGNISPTGVNGVPSGINGGPGGNIPLRYAGATAVPYGSPGAMNVFKTIPTGVGKWTVQVPAAPNGVLEGWPELSVNSTGWIFGITPILKDVQGIGGSLNPWASGGYTGAPTGAFYNINLVGPTGAPADPVAGDVIGLSFRAFGTGSATGP
jgi:hypothetical protein